MTATKDLVGPGETAASCREKPTAENRVLGSTALRVLGRSGIRFTIFR